MASSSGKAQQTILDYFTEKLRDAQGAKHVEVSTKFLAAGVRKIADLEDENEQLKEGRFTGTPIDPPLEQGLGGVASQLRFLAEHLEDFRNANDEGLRRFLEGLAAQVEPHVDDGQGGIPRKKITGRRELFTLHSQHIRSVREQPARAPRLAEDVWANVRDYVIDGSRESREASAERKRSASVGPRLSTSENIAAIQDVRERAARGERVAEPAQSSDPNREAYQPPTQYPAPHYPSTHPTLPKPVPEQRTLRYEATAGPSAGVKREPEPLDPERKGKGRATEERL